jgi:hypothetical protein
MTNGAEHWFFSMLSETLAHLYGAVSLPDIDVRYPLHLNRETVLLHECRFSSAAKCRSYPTAPSCPFCQ